VSDTGQVTARMFGALYTYRKEQGLPSTQTVAIPAEGITGAGLAETIGLPPELIEGVFINRVVCGLDELIHPGDRVAFVPYGTPGPHRYYLGLYDAGKHGHDG